jgi:surface antigen
MNEATQKLYMSNDVPVGTSEEWSNPNTGTHGTVTLIQKSRYKGMPCRRLRHDIVLKRPTDSYRLVVDRCRTDEGEWKIVVP